MLTYKGKEYNFSLNSEGDTYQFSRADEVTFIDWIVKFFERLLDNENYACRPRGRQLEAHVAGLVQSENWHQRFVDSVLRTRLSEKQLQEGVRETRLSLEDLWLHS